jgi:Flp pilus assembly protein TadG
MNFSYYYGGTLCHLGFCAMPSPANSTIPAKGLLRRFRRSRGGSAAVEFALVAPAFFALLFAIIESGIMFFAGQVLESVTQNAARTVLTGQAQTTGYSQTTFMTTVVCPAGSLANVLFNCVNNPNNLPVDVRSYSAFSNVVMSSQIDGGGNFINNMQYNPGGPGDIVVVRMFYQWPLFVTGLGYNVANLTGNKRLLYGTAAFKNEPY